MLDFAQEELLGVDLLRVSKHRYGCRCVTRLVYHGAASKLLPTLLAAAVELCRAEFGQYVMRAIAENTVDMATQSNLSQAFAAEACGLALHKNATHVLESALRHWHASATRSLRAQLLLDVELLARSRRSRYVLKAAFGL